MFLPEASHFVQGSNSNVLANLQVQLSKIIQHLTAYFRDLRLLNHRILYSNTHIPSK